MLHRVFGYEQFRGEQAAIVDQVIAGGDALVLMPTGGGKSLCYQIPALVRPGTGVVISPLIALMQDQVDALSAVGVRASFLNSTQDAVQRREVEAALLAGELDLLYLAPERLKLSSHARPARPRPDRAVRDRRGALRLAVGSRLPPRLPAAVGAARAVAGRAAHRAHRDGDRCHAARDPDAIAADRRAAVRRQLRPAQHPVPHRGQRPAARRSCSRCCAPSTPAMRASCTACRAHRSRRPPTRWSPRASRRCRITRASTRRRARATSRGSCAKTASSWSRPSRSAWGSTSPTCGSSPTSTCPRASRGTTRRPVVPGATGCRRPRGWPTGCRMSCSSAA